MANTVEQIHTKIISRIDSAAKIGALLAEVDDNIRKNGPSSGKNGAIMAVYRAKKTPQVVCAQLIGIENDYRLRVTPSLNDYYTGKKDSAVAYNRIVSSENFTSSLDDIITKFSQMSQSALDICTSIRSLSSNRDKITAIQKQLAALTNSAVELPLEKKDTETCKCGTRMDIVAEESKLVCPNPFCNKVKTLVGVVFRDDQFYTQDGQKSKHNGYDTSRHYRFWIDRLQAREVKTFSAEEMTKIKYVIDRDKYNCRFLKCRDMRAILKDPKVDLTNLNDHVPLLIKTFGGIPPPQLTFQEDQMLSMRFDNAMRLYEIVHADGGNKPYYPYFIYKLVEYAFKDNPEKLRLLEYIHLQSRDTVIKNDITYKQMAALSCPEDGIVYVPTRALG